MPCCSKPRRCRVPVTLIILIVYFCYLLLGATVFWALERDAEVEQIINFHNEKWELLKNHTCMDDKTLQMFITGVINAYKNGVPLQGNDTDPWRWDFTGSFFFSVTAITTIGYGNLSPSTVGGQIFCVFFALFGIPLNLILLNRIGQKMLGLVQKSADYLGRKMEGKKTVKISCNICAVLIGLLLFFLLPPLVFQAMEGWTYQEGFYYSFITLSTIGFGDYVVGQDPDKNYPTWYRNIVSLWILLGMAWLALIITLCINLLESTRNICLCCKSKDDEKRELIILTKQTPIPLQGSEGAEPNSTTSKAASLE